MFILLPAFAKVNLALEVGGRLPGGYHQVRTVFQAISLCDLVLLELAPHLDLACDRPGIPPGGANLAYRAAQAFREWTARQGRRSDGAAGEATVGAKALPGVRVTLFKAVPSGAGLGGGSSDAAATLRGLTWLWGVRPPPEDMERLAAALGSDVPFFLRGGTALGEGRGERCRVLPELPPCPLVVVCPPREVSTGEVYRLWDDTRPPARPPGRGVEAVAAAVRRGDVAGVAGALWNDLRSVTERLAPEAAEAREMLLESGALGAEMSGSGPAVFGIFPSLALAARGVDRARTRGYRAFLCRPGRRWPLYPGEGELL